jgi:aspartyl-tRNA(Asn)/glutamyl-tRNA(Gln) amidotransferase subunit A
MPPLPNSILQVAELLRTKALSPVEVTSNCLSRIEELNPALNAFITVNPDLALAQAREAETEILRGRWRGPLHGIPLGLKDLIDTAGIRTTAASAVFKDRIPDKDADVVGRLKTAGAVLLGKQNLHEFAYGGSSVISYFGEVHNPWNLEHIAGGSSGGSAAAVAAELGYGAIGTDTAGSIREPAVQCGIVGFKPTYGRVSARGVIPLSKSLDHVGPIARTVGDAAVILQAIADPEARDSGGRVVPIPNHLATLSQGPRALRVGIPRSYFFDDLDPEVSAAVESALALIKSLVTEVRDIMLSVRAGREVQNYEAYLYHAEFLADHSNLYQPETLRRILAGRSTEWSAYTRSVLQLRENRKQIASIFEDVDVLVTPAVPIPPPTVAELQQSPELLRPRELILLRNTHPFNVWGLPAVSIPCGFTRSGLPIGLQIAGPHWGEMVVLVLANAYEQATEWHKRRPAIVENQPQFLPSTKMSGPPD